MTDDPLPLPVPVPVKVSAASARQMFHPCAPDFIRDVCKAACCRSTVDPSGTAITVTGDTEADRIETLGAQVDRTTLRIEPINRRCPFQDRDTHLCGIHTQQPFGCVASPFTVNDNNTLVIRNRYRLLKCFKADGAIPAYVAHARSLRAIFGDDEADRIAAHLAAGGGDITAYAHPDTVANLRDKNRRSKS